MRTADPRIVLGLHRSRHQRHLLTGALDLGIHALDTSFNYHGFTSHKTLAQIGSDLLPHFTVSTKVGYFPGPNRAEHSLEPTRLRSALEQTNRDLGRPPDLVFLHNPEHSLRVPDHRPGDMLAQACATLAEAAANGMCKAWGIASWDPSRLPGLIDKSMPTPSVLMVRAGLLVGISTLEAAGAAADAWGLNSQARWGMSPFGGNARNPVWGRTDPRLFLKPADSEPSTAQAAFRTAYSLPRVSTIAVGSDDPAHLSELLDALDLPLNAHAVDAYRKLLRDRQPSQLA
ncbi:aldo/keto reductase [Streptomyces wuyuanensis]|uniref:aldo/keto reductase n=1 Tax=Streptomyces wuyuanensis TaxID=1196353 RepID=UPI000B891E31|nr:aldo/keto reductase [Streptomyces wuyuanensis]